MQANILWKGIEYNSLENCLLTADDSGNWIESNIIGSYQRDIYHVEYRIHTNTFWETIYCELKTQVNGVKQQHRFENVEVDLPLTPFTNTLPIRRLKMKIGQAREIVVLYLDVLTNEFRPVRQKYERLSDFQYKYENIPNDFEAVITVDKDGFVVDYPGLFLRT